MIKTIVFLFLAMFVIHQTEAQIAIGINPPDPSAAFHVQDTTKGLLIPRMTASQKNAIVNPADGLLVYQTNGAKGLWLFINGVWQNIIAPNNGGKLTIYLSDNITNEEAQAKIIAEAGPNTQEVKILRCSTLTSVDLSMLTNLTEIYISGNPVLQSINLDNLRSVDGGIFIEKCPSLTSLPMPLLQKVGQTIGGTFGLHVLYTAITSLNFPLLTQVNGTININGNNALLSIGFPQMVQHLIIAQSPFAISDNTVLTSFSCPVLTNVGMLVLSGKNLTSVNLPLLTTARTLIVSNSNFLSFVSLPALTTVSGELMINGNGALTILSIPALATTGMFWMEGNAALTSLSLPVLTTVSDVIWIYNNNSLSSLSLPSLGTAGYFNFTNNPSISTLSFPSLTSLTGGTSNFTGCTNLVSISFDALTNFANAGFNVKGSKLPSSQVNYLLNKFVSITPPIVNKNFDFRQSIPAPPTGQGITDKATLIARPNTVNTD